MAGRSRGRPKLDEAAAVEAELLAAALKEFLQHGYGGASLTRIVKAAGASKTTLYSRYASKEALFRAVMYMHMERLPASMPLHHYDLESGLKAYLNQGLDVSLTGELLEVNRLIYSESHRFPELGRAATERSQLGIAQLAAFIGERAVIDGIACRDPVAVAEACIYLMLGRYVIAMMTKSKIPPATRRAWVDGAVRLLIEARGSW
ncbi:TetR/AcrR family transcriptional regulator [Acidocella sp.]|uniref:TetR/AcrR family transcriptional regulator n=1 Tax=Acidocella sp. TaxID=50710 RepID=UPI00262729BF|nr:TetR/AcrR family transcriptional regulator [Acidocella sp.]